MRWLPIVTALAAGCSGGDAAPKEDDPTPICDGRLQADEGEVIDSTFDNDGDGYVDGNNSACASVYAANALDCDDQNPDVNPGAVEVPCNDYDDDCNSDTPNAVDADRDGYSSCEDDCDDDDPVRNPGLEEECWDDIDNNCDEVVDEGCGPDYNGIFALNQALVYDCGLLLVQIDFAEVTVLWNPPYATILSNGGIQPGSMDGTIEEDGSFVVDVTNALSTAASCEEIYQLRGQFLDEDTFEAEFEVRFIGGFTCLNCNDQLITGLVGTRTGGF